VGPGIGGGRLRLNAQGKGCAVFGRREYGPTEVVLISQIVY